MNFITDIFTLIIYQPFLNLLVFIYWALLQLPRFPHADMGMAVIIFTVALRFLMMPITLRATRTEKERFEIESKIKEINAKHVTDPVAQKQEMKTVLKERPSMVFSEVVNLVIQVAIALMLWRIFAKGLGGEDLHLLYPFTPHPPLPYNLVFLGIYDLTHPHMSLNILQALLVFILETIHLMTSPYPHTRKDAVRLQLILPIVAFIFFSMMPAGKKLFVIVTLTFSIIFSLLRHGYHLIRKAMALPDAPLTVVEPAPLAPIAPEESQVAPNEEKG